MSDKARRCPDCGCSVDDPYHLKRVVEAQTEYINLLVWENMERRTERDCVVALQAALGRAVGALESGLAAIGDHLHSLSMGGHGIVKEYAEATQEEFRKALSAPLARLKKP